MNIGTLIGAFIGAIIGIVIDFGLFTTQQGRMVITCTIAGGFMGSYWWDTR